MPSAPVTPVAWSAPIENVTVLPASGKPLLWSLALTLADPPVAPDGGVATAADSTTTRMSCDRLSVPPGVVVVKAGSTRVSADMTISAARPAPDPSTRNVCS